ncbi:MAG: hypothetical protein WCN92_05015, partial [Eubacteriales bacterium]
RNIPLPRLFFIGRTLNTFDFNCIDRDFVVKPDNSADSDCVLLFRNGKELFSGQTEHQMMPCSTVRKFLISGYLICHHIFRGMMAFLLPDSLNFHKVNT